MNAREARWHAQAMVFHAEARRILALHGVAVDVRGTWPEGAVLAVASHRSALDPLIVGAAITAVPIMARTGRVELDALSAGYGALLVSPADPHDRARVLRAAWRRLAAGVSVLNFPEGGAGQPERLLDFAPGLFAVAQRLGVPILPIGVEFSVADAERDADTRPLVPVAGARLRVTVHVGTRLSPTPSISAAQLATTARRRVAALLGR